MTSAQAGTSISALPARPLDRGRGSWGMAMFITTEASLFVMLLFVYFYLAAGSAQWPPELPGVALGAGMTVLLVSSSVILHRAGRSIVRGNRSGLGRGLFLTVALGVAFLGGQALEYREHWKTLTPQTSPYGSIFYTIISVHGAHVFVGLLMLLFVALGNRSGHFGAEHHLAVRNVSWYWHFVDVAWLVIFATLYLVPRFWR